MNTMKKLQVIKKRARTRNMKFDLDKEWLQPKLEKGVCEVTDIQFIIQENGTVGPFTPSIDRVDNNKGYTKDNCQLVLFTINNCKGEGSYEDMYKWSKKFVEVYENA